MQKKFQELSDSEWEVIKKYLENHQPKKLNLREVVNAILWITRSGTQWRLLDSKYPKWESVYYYFDIWKNNGVFESICSELVIKERQRQGKQAQPSVVAVDSQSVKTVSFIHLDTGIDGGKRVNGRKRHIAVDTLGLPIAIHVSSANTSDNVGGFDLLWQLDKSNNDRLLIIKADGGYKEQFIQAAALHNWEVDVAKKPESAKGFIPQNQRWQVERSFGWMNFFRRLAKSYERKVCSEIAFIQLMFISILFSRNKA